MAAITTLQWTLGDRLAKARRYANVSTETMAVALGVSRKTVYNYEADKTPIRVGLVRVWADECNVPLEWLLTGAEQGVQPLQCSSRIAQFADSAFAYVA